MTNKEVRSAVYSAVWRIIRQLDPPPIDDFMQTAVEKTFDDANPPETFKDFWWESIAVEIQGGVMAHKEFVDKFPPEWLKQNKTKTWEDVSKYIFSRLIPLAV